MYIHGSIYSTCEAPCEVSNPNKILKMIFFFPSSASLLTNIYRMQIPLKALVLKETPDTGEENVRPFRVIFSR